MTIQTVLVSQYRASLAMLLDAIERCPPDLWASASHRNAFWRVAYHTLYYAHLYLQPSEADFVAWTHHRPGYHRFEPVVGEPDGVSAYSVEDLRVYCRQLLEMVDAAVNRLDLSAPDSGFSWYQMSKLEHQFVSIRHIQHHVGQLADRLRSGADIGLRWVGEGGSR